MNERTENSHEPATSLLTHRNCRLAAFTFFAAMILIGAIPGKADALSTVIWDKLLHFAAYSFLSALIYGALQGGPALRALLTVIIVALLGAGDEFLQAFLSYRNANLVDWQMDMLAACVTVTLLWSVQAARIAYGIRQGTR